MVEHQPGYQRRENFIGKGNLKHRRIVGTHVRIMPAAELDRKSLADRDAELLWNGLVVSGS